MNTRLAIAIAAALLLPLGAATPEISIAQGTSGELRIALRIRPPGDAGAGLPNYEASVRRALLDTGTPRSIALASMSTRAPATREDASIGNDRVVRAAETAPDDALVQWIAAERLLALHDDARAGPIVSKLTAQESDNAAAWSLALALAQLHEESLRIDDALARMAASTRADEHVGDAMHAWLDVYEAHPRPRSAFVNPAEADAAPFADAMTAAKAMRVSHDAFASACAAASEASRRHACAGAARVLLHTSTSVATRELGFSVLERLGDANEADRAERRDLAWIRANADRTSALDAASLDAVRSDWETLGDEAGVLRRAMRRAGVAADAPDGWSPDGSGAIARSGAG